MDKLKQLSKQLIAAKSSLRRHTLIQYEVKRVNAGLIFTNTLNGGKEIEKIYRPSRMTWADHHISERKGKFTKFLLFHNIQQRRKYSTDTGGKQNQPFHNRY